MTRAKLHRLIRKWHRYLGLFLGIQLLLWTIGGLYFSWTNIDQVRGDDVRKKESSLNLEHCTTSLQYVLSRLNASFKVEHLMAVQLVNVLDSSYYQITFHNGERTASVLAKAATGALRQPLSEKEAVEVAKAGISKVAKVEKVEYLTEVGAHHEYRENPLPAYAISFGGEVYATVYVSTEKGTIQKIRNNRWRVFDFLWMLHTMDYEGRDDINNWILRIFSLLGLVALLSGFALYWVSRKRKVS